MFEVEMDASGRVTPLLPDGFVAKVRCRRIQEDRRREIELV